MDPLERIKDILRPVKRLFIPAKNYDYFTKLSTARLQKEGIKAFRKKFGKDLSRENVKTINEKLQWLKIYDDLPLKTEMVDKLAVREHVKARLGEKYLNRIWGPYHSADEIDFSVLPDRFVIKSNQGSGLNYVVKDKAKIDLQEISRITKKWLAIDHASFFFELHYRGIKPLLFVEEYLENSKYGIYDYKVHVYNEQPLYIEFVGGRNIQPLHEMFFDTEWNPQPFIVAHTRFPEIPAKPRKLEELLSCAKKMSRGFSYVRADFYILNTDEIRFGEMTFVPDCGEGVWDPPEWEALLGEKLTLPDRKIIFE